jgi:hypothetical protein
MGDTTELSPAQTPTDSPEPTATLEPAPLSEPAQAEPGGEPAQVEGEKVGAEKTEPPAWATVSDASELLDHEGVKPLHEERLNTARETAKKEGASETHRRLQPLIDRQQDTLRGIDEKVGRFTDSWNRIARTKDAEGNPVIDKAALQDLLDDNREAFAALGGLRQSEGMWSGAAGLVKELADAMKSESFTSAFRPRLERMQRGDTDSSIFADMVDAIADSAKEPLKAELKERDAKITRLETEVREAKRNGQPSPANPPGGGGGGGKSVAEEDDILMNPETHIDVIREITARRKARA